MAKNPSLGTEDQDSSIEKPNHRQVTFSKSRSGLFKKACKLCTLCGVEIAIIVFSPTNKVFSFGHPNVESIVNKFIGRADISDVVTSASANSSVRELNVQLTHVNGLIDAEKERKESLERVKEWWWEMPVEKLGKTRLEELAATLEELKMTVALKAQLVNETKPETEELIYMFSGFARSRGFGGFSGNKLNY